MTYIPFETSFPASVSVIFFVCLPVTLRFGNLRHRNTSRSFLPSLHPHKPTSNIHLQSLDSRRALCVSGTSFFNSLPSLRIETMSQRPVTSRARGVCAFYATARGCVHGGSCKFLHGESQTYSPYDKNKTCKFILAGMSESRLSVLRPLTAPRFL